MTSVALAEKNAQENGVFRDLDLTLPFSWLRDAPAIGAEPDEEQAKNDRTQNIAAGVKPFAVAHRRGRGSAG